MKKLGLMVVILMIARLSRLERQRTDLHGRDHGQHMRQNE